MKILYGIQSPGNGHISRSIKIIHRLIKVGCRVDILLSGNNSQVSIPFPVKWNLNGFTLYYDNFGNLNITETWRKLNFNQFLKDIRMDISDYDIIISDFEPITAWASKLKDKKCWGISNQASFLSKKTPRPKSKSILGELIFKKLVPVTNPIGLHFQKYDTFIYTPIIKDTILRLDPKDKGHYLVYLPNHNLDILIDCLSKHSYDFQIFTKINYNFKVKNCKIKPIDKVNFESSLETCTGVITAAGFQTPSESIYLGKKLMVIPINGQYEQECNAVALGNLGAFVGGIDQIDKFMEKDWTPKIYWEDSTNEIVGLILRS